MDFTIIKFVKQRTSLSTLYHIKVAFFLLFVVCFSKPKDNLTLLNGPSTLEL